jgi:prepilin-type N-terminal cleavage/methylation domain-containing protein
MRSASAGFTLLEVLAAVAVIGVAFTSLAAWNIDGLRAESLARGRLEASIVADYVLAELEAELAAGVTPPVGRIEREQDGFAVALEVEPLPLGLEPVPTTAGGPGTASTTPSGPTLLAAPGSRGDTPLRLVRITVAFGDPETGDRVVRETFAFDAASVSSLLAGLAEAPGETGGPAGGPRAPGAASRRPTSPRPVDDGGIE